MKTLRKNRLFLKTVSLLAAILMCVSSLSSCSFLFDMIGGNKIEGEWYNERGKCLEVFSDGTYKCEGEYGTGEWKKLDDSEYQFLDFYGDDTEITIEEDEYGTYIEYNGRKYYKDEYPEIDGNEGTASGKENSGISNENENQLISLDPFKGISFTVSGISPYCTISVNNQDCDANVQKYVEYSLDKSQYANGDSAVITAKLSYTSKSKYKLSSDTYSYTVSGQPEYLTSLTGVDLTNLKAELADYVAAGEAAVIADSNYLFSIYHTYTNAGTGFTSCDSSTLKNTYFSSLKSTKTSSFRLGRTPFNQISFIYEMDYSWENVNSRTSGTGTAWFNISACNLVKYPNGSIKWGTESIGAYDFTCDHSTQSLEDCISATVTVNSANYNITKVN